ncbi:MAG: AzlD domain-containing protein [Microbacteriaceae bacterium]
MTMWLWVLIACAIGYLTKQLGYLVPQKWMKNATMVNTVATGQQLVFDARLGALIAAAVALWLRAPFLVVVLVGALAAAGLRMLGWA